MPEVHYTGADADGRGAINPGNSSLEDKCFGAKERLCARQYLYEAC